jgi:capsular polysaccharide biosynthesis protein
VPVRVRTRVKRRLVELQYRVGRHSLAEIAAGLELPEPWTAGPWLSSVESVVDDSALRTIVVITANCPAKVGRLFALRYRGAAVHVLDAARHLRQGPTSTHPRVRVHRTPELPAMHRALVPLPSVQVIVEGIAGGHAQRTARFRELMYHLEDGGQYVVAPDSSPGDADTTADVREVVAELIAAKHDPRLAERTDLHPDDRVRLTAVGSVSNDGEFLAVRRVGRQVLKLHDDEAEAAMRSRRGEAWGRRLDSRPPMTFTARGTLHANEQPDSFKTVMPVPELTLREYNDVVCAPRSVVVQDDLVLPISFHHGQRVRLEQASEYLAHGSRSFATLDESARQPPHLPGTYYHLDSEFPWHFGHFVTEDISKLWGYDTARTLYPDLKVLLSMRHPGEGPKPHQLALLNAWGVPADAVVCIDAPVRVDRLIGAGQMFYNGLYVHPELSAIWDRLRDALRAGASPRRPTARRLFVLRPPNGARPCRNSEAVERVFAEHGFELIRPEQLSIADQVELFDGAEVVAGYGGSGLFNTIYANHPGRRIVIASTEYRARNEWTIAALRGDDYHHFFCPAEITHPKGRWESRAFHSAFSFDFDRDGDTLRELLRD